MSKRAPSRTPEAKPEPGGHEPWPALWFWESEIKVFTKFIRLLARDPSLRVTNSSELGIRKSQIRQATNNWTACNFLLPDDFPVARIAMTQADFAPDYFSQGGFDFCSRRLRDALAQPEDVVQFLPIELVAGGEAVRAQDYRRMHILAQQPAMDIARSDCELEKITHRVTGRVFTRVEWIDRFVLLDGFEPRTEMFHPEEAPSRVLSTDALATRVLAASCTGLEFRDPAVPWHGIRVERLRTTTGIAERRVGFLD